MEEFEQKYKGIINDLRNKVLTNDGDDRFKVFDIEAGLGKSYAIDELLKEELKSGSSNRYIVVKKFNSEIELTFKYITDEKKTDDVVAIDSKNWTKYKKCLDKVRQAKIVLITHNRYINLCLDDEMRNVFKQDRNILIIDEKMTFPVSYYSRNRRHDMNFLVDNKAEITLMKLCSKLDSYINNEIKSNNQQLRRKQFNASKFIKKYLESLSEYARGIKSYSKRNDLLKFLFDIDTILNQGQISIFNPSVNEGTIFCQNPKYKHWGIENGTNIILDASASIDGIYKLNPNKYVVHKAERITDHSKSDFKHYQYNTSKSNIDKVGTLYLKPTIEYIVMTQKDDDKTFIVAHKGNINRIKSLLIKNGVKHDDIYCPSLNDDVEEDNDVLGEQSYILGWYGSIVGKNYAKHCNVCWILSTPALSNEQFIMQYQQYSDSDLSDIRITSKDGVFHNDELKALQNGYTQAEIYQAIKRIQRTMKPEGRFNLISISNKVARTVAGELLNINRKRQSQLNIDSSSKKKSNKSANKLVSFLKTLDVGEYPKSFIKASSNIANLARELKSSDVAQLVADNKIAILNKSIKVKKKLGT